jgi:hypothetical protein
MFRVDEVVLLCTKYGCRLELARHGTISTTVARICHMVNYCGGKQTGGNYRKQPRYSKPFQRPLPPLHTIGKHHVNP